MKFLSFESLLKNQKPENKLNNSNNHNELSETKENYDSIGLKTSTKMFFENVSLSKLNVVTSRTIQSGFLKTKTYNNEKKNNYFRLRQYGDKRIKILLECYKDDSLKKVKFIIDLDNVDQVDLKENLNTIYLSKDNEKCSLDAGNKKNTLIWLNAICENCGFNEINNYQSRDLKTKNYLSNSTKNLQLNEKTTVKLNKIETSDLEKKFQPKTDPKSNSNKIIAGFAASSVGSYDLCNAHLEKIFQKKSNEPNTDFNKSTNFLDSLLMHHESDDPSIKKSYIDLQECLSGIDSHSQSRSESNIKVANQNDLETSKSVNSLFKISPKKKAVLDEEYSVFVENTYYNFMENTNTQPHNDYINYTETFDDQNHDLGLRYVPLEVLEIENSPIYYSTEYYNRNKYLKDMANQNQNVVSKNAVSKNKIHTRNFDQNKMYTEWDAIRTQALKTTQAEFKRPSS